MVAMELPSDLVEEILSWVPVKSLARLKFTCKQWETLISDPRFAEKHLSHMRCREQQFTVFNDVSNNETSWVSTVSCVGVDFDEINNEPNLNIEVLDPLPFSNLWVQSMYHCDGLLLFVTKTKLLVLNPLLKQARWIKCGYSVNNHSVDAYGLGYISNQSSSSCNEYKMVRFCCGSSSHSKIQVYEFKSNRWRDVVDKSFGGFSELPESSVCLKGTPYWIGYRNFSLTLQSFDFSKERFQTLSTPPRFFKLSKKKKVSLSGDFSLGVFRGDRLSLLHKYHTSEIHLWVMSKKKYWSNLMIIDVLDPSRFLKYSSYFIEKIGKLVLSFRDSASINVYFVGMDDDEEPYAQYSSMNSSICRSVCYYVPSLLPVPGFFEAKKKVKYLSKKRKRRSGT